MGVEGGLNKRSESRLLVESEGPGQGMTRGLELRK